VLFYTSLSAAAEATVQTREKGAAMGLGENGTGRFPTGKTGGKTSPGIGYIRSYPPSRIGCSCHSGWFCLGPVATPEFCPDWSQVWYGADERYCMIEKQLLAAYSALQAVEPITQTAEVIVKTTLPIQGWVKDLTHFPKTGVALAQTVA